MPERTYPVVRSVTMLIPELAQARLREMPDGTAKRLALYWLLLGMGVSLATAHVDLEKMTVEVTL